MPYKSLLTWLNSNVALWPSDISINAMLADLEALWQIPKTRLARDPLLGCASQCLGRKDADKLHVFVSIIKLMNMLEEKDCAHGVGAA